ncbi:DegT/DnrJ/EryC1/StrS family aminotransferase [bacterium]|nr:DegT/DnrJ/EryC1/StrS family aminotransferase [bacterium]
MMIPILELKTQYAEIREEVERAVCEVLSRTHYILGPEVAAFEKEFAEWNGAAYGIGCASGTDALVLALKAVGVKPGDEVIAPPFTFMATAGAVSSIGAQPVFCDIQPGSFNLDPAEIEKLITPRTKAIEVVHLYGHPADMDPILEIARKHHLKVVEDCAQATGATYHGKKVGTMGDAGAFSFFPSKNLGCAGDGGLVLTNNADVDERVRCLRGHGSRRKYFHDELGTNSRLDEVQAAVLRVKLRHLERWNEKRRAVAAKYSEHLKGFVTPPPVAPGCQHVFHQYTLRTTRRDEMMTYLNEKGVGAIIYYPLALHLQQVYAAMGHKLGDFPVTEKAQDEVLSLPMYPELNEGQIEQVVQTVKDFHSQPVQAG